MKENGGLVECPSCQKNVSPRLWHNNIHSLLLKSTTAHICPICGVTMYTSGKAGLEPLAMFIVAFFILAAIEEALIIPSIEALQYIGFSQTAAVFFSISVFIVVSLIALSYKYPRIKREFNYIKTMIKTYF